MVPQGFILWFRKDSFYGSARIHVKGSPRGFKIPQGFISRFPNRTQRKLNLAHVGHLAEQEPENVATSQPGVGDVAIVWTVLAGGLKKNIQRIRLPRARAYVDDVRQSCPASIAFPLDGIAY
jgi:hypothetical protein